jgi:hypothetical protein
MTLASVPPLGSGGAYNTIFFDLLLVDVFALRPESGNKRD